MFEIGKERLDPIQICTDELADENSKHKLFLKQKELLETFLEHGAISPDQFDKSLNDLSEKMGEKA